MTQGRFAANLMPVVASNGIRRDATGQTEITFDGSSFITDGAGAILAEADRQSETHVAATVDLDETAAHRRNWGVFRDRRPDQHAAILTLDGKFGRSSRFCITIEFKRKK